MLFNQREIHRRLRSDLSSKVFKSSCHLLSQDDATLLCHCRRQFANFSFLLVNQASSSKFRYKYLNSIISDSMQGDRCSELVFPTFFCKSEEPQKIQHSILIDSVCFRMTRGLAIRTACYYGHPECIETAQNMFQSWMENPDNNP